METITIDNDIKVFYTTAKSFPEGIMEAHGCSTSCDGNISYF
jgi:hypothetical protein